MKIIIAGTGEVGFHLSKLLAQEEHDIVIIDNNEKALERASKNLDVSTIKGDATSLRVLENARAARCDLLIAVTSSQQVNILACTMAKSFGVKKCIARISNTELLHKKDTFDLESIGIDKVIYPETLGANEIKNLLKESAATDTVEFDKGLLHLIGIMIDDNSALKDKTLAETAHLNPDIDFTTVAIVRDKEGEIKNETIIPRSNNIFKEGDHAYFVAKSNQGIDRVLSLTGKKHASIKNIMIYGGSDLAYITAKHLSKKYNIKLICEDRENCEKLADNLPNVMVLNGNGADVNFLMDEGLDEMDAFLALSNGTEKNILAALAAKESGVKKTISQVENIDYIPLAQNMGVNTTINIKYLAANFIFKYIREDEVINFTLLQGVDAEVVEVEVKENSKVLTNKLKDLDFPKSGVVGGVIRNNKPLLPRGDFEFEVKDRVIIVSKHESLHSIESMFK